MLLVRNADELRRQNDYRRGADLVAEVVSPDNPERDTDVKRLDQAMHHAACKPMHCSAKYSAIFCEIK